MSIVPFVSRFDKNCLLQTDFNTNNFTIISPVLAKLFHAGTHKRSMTELTVCFRSYFARASKINVPRNFQAMSEEGKLSTK